MLACLAPPLKSDHSAFLKRIVNCSGALCSGDRTGQFGSRGSTPTLSITPRNSTSRPAAFAKIRSPFSTW